MIELYESLGDQGYDAVISIHLASTISGLVQTLETVKDTVDNIQVVPVDSEITVLLMGYLAIEALVRVQQATFRQVLRINYIIR